MEVLLSEVLELVLLETVLESSLVSAEHSFSELCKLTSYHFRCSFVDKLLEARMLDCTFRTVFCREKLLDRKLSRLHQVKIGLQWRLIQSKHLVKILNLWLIAELQTMLACPCHRLYLLSFGITLHVFWIYLLPRNEISMMTIAFLYNLWNSISLSL